jgi:hypothetical protein
MPKDMIEVFSNSKAQKSTRIGENYILLIEGFKIILAYALLELRVKSKSLIFMVTCNFSPYQ